MYIGEKISVILGELEQLLWEYEAKNGEKPNYTKEGLRASTKIFMSVIMDKMWELQEYEDLSKEDRINMATSVGNKVRTIIKTYTGIDSHDLYKDNL